MLFVCLCIIFTDMIPNLRQTHESKLKNYLLELKTNPELLQEYYDQQQLDSMRKALKKLTEIFKNPEFKNLTSFQMAIQKAYAELHDLLDKNKLVRALKLGSELKRITTLISGMSTLFNQLPTIVEIAQGSMPENWGADDPISAVISNGDVTSFSGGKTQKLRRQIKKAMKPGAFSDLPYINSDEAITELLNLSINQITKLHEIFAASHIMKQTVGNPDFVKKVSVNPETKEKTDQKIKLKMPGVPATPEKTAEPTGEDPAVEERDVASISVSEFREIWDTNFNSALRDEGLDPEKKSSMKLSTALKQKMLVALYKKGLIHRNNG